MNAPRMLSITVTGPEAMLEAMANLLRSEGYTVVSPGEIPAGAARGDEQAVARSKRVTKRKAARS
jgi:DUF1009 family protein